MEERVTLKQLIMKYKNDNVYPNSSEAKVFKFQLHNISSLGERFKEISEMAGPPVFK